MLYDIYTSQRREPQGRDARNQTLEAADVRLNPWLLWRPERPQARELLTVAELAECHCPDLCNRDHQND